MSTNVNWIFSFYSPVGPGLCLGECTFSVLHVVSLIASDPEISPQFVYFTSTPVVKLLSQKKKSERVRTTSKKKKELFYKGSAFAHVKDLIVHAAHLVRCQSHHHFQVRPGDFSDLQNTTTEVRR